MKTTPKVYNSHAVASTPAATLNTFFSLTICAKELCTERKDFPTCEPWRPVRPYEPLRLNQRAAGKNAGLNPAESVALPMTREGIIDVKGDFHAAGLFFSEFSKLLIPNNLKNYEERQNRSKTMAIASNYEACGEICGSGWRSVWLG